MTKLYTIDFTVTLSTCRDIPAETEQEAIDIAYRLLDNDDYREDLIASWDSPFAGWSDPDDPKVLTSYECSPEAAEAELEYLRERYGLE